MGDLGEVAGHRFHVVTESLLERLGGQLEALGQVGQSCDQCQTGQDPQRHGDPGARLMRLTVAAELAEEREVHAAGHVGGGEGRGDHAHDQHEGVGAVAAGATEEAPSAGAGQDFVLRPESGERR